jgi:putative hydrolase of the HAD superfamily
MSVTVVIFDFGGVLSLPQDPERLTAMERLSNLDHERYLELYRRDRLELDRGTLTDDSYWGRILRAGGVEPTAQAVAALEEEDCHGWTRLNGAMVAWAGELRAAGYRTAILSNMPFTKLAFLRSRGEFAWIADFDAAVWSCEHRLVKPDPAFYRLCLRRLGVEPGSCLFLDDTEANVEGARAVGINGQLFVSVPATAPELARRWGLPTASLAGSPG